MRNWLITIALFASMVANAAMIIETVELRYRPAEEIIPVIQPLLVGDGSITGSGYKLFIKSTPENLEEIKEFITEIDVDKSQLLIHVAVNNRQSMEEDSASVSVEASSPHGRVRIEGNPGQADAGSVSSGTDSQIKYDARIFNRESNKSQPVSQTVRVSDGYWATIQMGQSVPVATRLRNPDGTVTETLTYQNVTTGFRVMPRTQGNNVTLTIMPFADTLNTQHPGTINTSAMETTVTGRIGQWIHLGGTNIQSSDSSSGITYRTRVRDTTHNQIWIKVERPKHAVQN